MDVQSECVLVNLPIGGISPLTRCHVFPYAYMYIEHAAMVQADDAKAGECVLTIHGR